MEMVEIFEKLLSWCGIIFEVKSNYEDRYEERKWKPDVEGLLCIKHS